MAPRPDDLSLEQARRISLSAQGLRGARAGGGIAGMLRRLGAVQLDTISVLARSHELVTYARRGPTQRTRIDQAFWGPKSSTFEYWSHAACVLPLEDWPAYAFKRRARLAKGRRWHRLEDQEKSCREVLTRLRAEGPLTANELGGAKKGGTWWDWSENKVAAEWLLDIGQLVCRKRRGFQRVYDLAERAIPSHLLDQEWSDEECAAHLVAAAARSLGVATVADLATYHGMLQAEVRHALASTEFAEVRVEGWKAPAYAHPEALEGLSGRGATRSVLLSPFDSLIWYRGRLERLFGLRHRLEAYTPRAAQVRLLRHAGAGRHQHRRVGRPRAPGQRAARKAGHPLRSRLDRARGAGPERSGRVDRSHIHRRAAGGAHVGPGRAPGARRRLTMTAG
ncbi:MAG TPA: crosslink repair DNA glycosylase YcaQ family protein [Acidimicrobiales bacterium]|nr:crosslink repair DNA glycosylase YcaQ family protein [Acidimicrobiales bacterium]